MKLIPEKTKDFGYLKVFDLYSEEELKNIWNEILNFLESDQVIEFIYV